MSDNNENKGRSEQAHLMETSFSGRNISMGDLVTGKIVKLAGEVAFVDYGGKSEGYVMLSELKDDAGNLLVHEGEEIEAVVAETKGAVRLSYREARQSRSREKLKEAWRNQQPVRGRVVGINKGGYEVRVDGVRAFCPSSQIDARPVKDPQTMVNQDFDFRITEFGEGKSLVVSRRALLDEERTKTREALAGRINVGDVLQGKVTQIRDFGAFVDLGGVEGLIHVSEISHERIKHPGEKLKVGEAVEVKVLRVETDKGRIALGLKQLAPPPSDPFVEYARTLEIGQHLTGTVVRMQPFGAFVNIAPGVDGLIHVSSITTEKRIQHPEEVLQNGAQLEVLVESIDLERKRIGLITAEVAEKRGAPQPEVKVGQVLKGKVVKIEKFGVFVELGPKATGLVPNAEMDTDRNADHTRLFPIGTELEVKVIDIDQEKRRIRLSRKALKQDEDERNYQAYRQSQGGSSSVTLGDLFGKMLKRD